jgi:hypothetical protein
MVIVPGAVGSNFLKNLKMATARIVDKRTESKLTEEVTNIMYPKYGWIDGLIVELTPYKEQVE